MNKDEVPELDFILSFIKLLEQFEDPGRYIIDINKAFRRDLFKLTYLKDTFPLYQKSDAGEAL